MRYKASSPEEYIKLLPKDRKQPIQKLREVILKNLSQGFEETMNYGMIGYVVPHSVYPNGYHCDPKMPLPFMNIASQKNYVAVYHMCIYSDKKLLTWFENEYNKYFKRKPDMGKSCIRFKKMDEIPFELIGKLAGKTTKDEWISIYEKHINK